MAISGLSSRLSSERENIMAMAASLYICGAVTFLNWDTAGRLVRPASHLSDFKSIWLIVHVGLQGMPLKSSGSCWGSVKDGLS